MIKEVMIEEQFGQSGISGWYRSMMPKATSRAPNKQTTTDRVYARGISHDEGCFTVDVLES
jgi:hypothetical protein